MYEWTMPQLSAMLTARMERIERQEEADTRGEPGDNYASMYDLKMWFGEWGSM